MTPKALAKRVLGISPVSSPTAAVTPDGKAIARHPGQVRYKILVTHAGTPADPMDDEFLADLRA